MTNDELRTCFALFAMTKMNWLRGTEAFDAKNCWMIADEMLKAKNLDLGGIASIKPKDAKNA